MATNTDIDVRAYYDEIHRIVQHFGLPVEAVEIVPSIQTWCHERGLSEDSPFRTARIVRNKETGRYLILMAERMTDPMISSVVSVLEVRGFRSEVHLLSDSLAFVRHLTLHELAHGLDDTRSEYECDRWAFDQLGTLPSNTTPHADARDVPGSASGSGARAGGRER